MDAARQPFHWPRAPAPRPSPRRQFISQFLHPFFPVPLTSIWSVDIEMKKINPNVAFPLFLGKILPP